MNCLISVIKAYSKGSGLGLSLSIVEKRCRKHNSWKVCREKNQIYVVFSFEYGGSVFMAEPLSFYRISIVLMQGCAHTCVGVIEYFANRSGFNMDTNFIIETKKSDEAT